MSKTFQDVTDAELSVLDVLWEHGPSTIRHLTDLLYPGGTNSHYATVQKLLERLDGKHYIERGRRGNVNIFAASLERDELLGRRLEHLAEQLCGGSWTPLLTHLVEGKRLSKKDRQALRKMIDDHDESSKRKTS